MTWSRLALAAAAWPLLTGCAQRAAIVAPAVVPVKSAFAGYSSTRYADPNAWVCLPGRANDPCLGNLDSTELRDDGSRAVVAEPPPATPPPFDCFYVYPTIDNRPEPGNHTDFTNIERMVGVTQAQVGHFRTVCRLYAPLYRQVTMGTYMQSQAEQDKYLAIASADVVDAFRHYMSRYNHGRKIVLIGHSQGAEMVTRLLKQFFDGDQDAPMREQLLLGMPIGGHIDVPRGQLVGGTFTHIPVCSRAAETGCVVGYRSVVAGSASPSFDVFPAGHVNVCVNPTALDGGPHPTTRTYLLMTDRLRAHMPKANEITTPFILLESYYNAECVETQPGVFSLAMSVAAPANDPRANPIDFDARLFRGMMGLHLVDMQLVQGDLIALIAHRATPHAARADSSGPPTGPVQH